MARGTGNVEEILYGRHMRSANFRIEIGEDGCQEYYDLDGILVKVFVPDEAVRGFEAPPVMTSAKTVQVTGPAMVYVENGKIHRDQDLPAIEAEDGGRFWYQHGCLHRDQTDQDKLRKGDSKLDDQERPAVIDPVKGKRAWWHQGKCHRVDGPAVIYTATKEGETDRWEYWEDGFMHREFGPAVVDFDGSEEFYIRGTRFGETEYDDALKDFINARWRRSH